MTRSRIHLSAVNFFQASTKKRTLLPTRFSGMLQNQHQCQKKKLLTSSPNGKVASSSRHWKQRYHLLGSALDSNFPVVSAAPGGPPPPYRPFSPQLPVLLRLTLVELVLVSAEVPTSLNVSWGMTLLEFVQLYFLCKILSKQRVTVFNI